MLLFPEVRQSNSRRIHVWELGISNEAEPLRIQFESFHGHILGCDKLELSSRLHQRVETDVTLVKLCARSRNLHRSPAEPPRWPIVVIFREQRCRVLPRLLIIESEVAFPADHALNRT